VAAFADYQKQLGRGSRKAYAGFMAQLLWTQKQDVGPSARSDVAMVFDAARGRVVLFGGAGGAATLFNDTWEWDGENWTQYEDIGPTPRSRHAMAYDSKRGRTVLFGGSAGTLNLSDTWEWDGDNWTQVADTGPSARGGHAMAYDSLRGRVILFGGDDGQNSFGDTWAWDGADWTQEADTGPPARTGHGMDYDNLRDRVVLVDGISKSTVQVQVQVWVQDSSGGWFSSPSGHYETHTQQQVKVQYLNDTWEYDGSVWTRVADTGPEPRMGCGLVYDGKTMLLFGGKNDTSFFKNTWEWDGKHWTQRQDIGPAARAFAAFAYDSARQRAVLFGGAAQSLFGDTWEQFFQA
jgi:hypothetical protein